MSLTKTVGLFVGSTLAVSGVAFGSTEANTDAMQQIAELKKEIAQLKAAQNGDNWLTEQRAAEIKGLVQDVLADADTRASLQGAGSTAGWDNGFFLSSQDGNFRLNISGGAQLRWTLSSRSVDTNNPANAGQEDTNWGFQTHAASMTFSGHIVDPSWQYKMNFNFYTADGDYAYPGPAGTAYVNEWWVLKDFGGFYLKAGQFTAPYSRERLLGDYNLQFLSRSNSNYVFGLGQTQGIEAGYLADMFRIALAYSDGLGQFSPTENAGYPNPNGPASPGTDFAIVGRAEVKLAGTWKQFQDQQSWRGTDFGLLLGIGAYWQDGGGGLAPPPGTAAIFPTYGQGGDQYGVTVDATAQFGGFNVATSLYYFQDDDFALGGGPNPTPGGPTDSEGFGWVLEGGFFLTDELELVGRYEYGDLSNLGGAANPVAFNNNLQSVISAGVNWYFAKNRAKWQTDIGYDFYGVGIFGVNGNGWYQDTVDANGAYEDGQFLLRTGITVNF